MKKRLEHSVQAPEDPNEDYSFNEVRMSAAPDTISKRITTRLAILSFNALALSMPAASPANIKGSQCCHDPKKHLVRHFTGFDLFLLLLTKAWDSYLSIAQKIPC